ncbi:MAG TPA: M14 family zinc carboxypeptidase [Candidatus Xenobia bacterium]|jgi:hypothetical protein
MPTSPLTRAEASGYLETSRHADVMTFLHTLQERHDPRLFITSFGSSPEGRDLPLVVLSEKPVKTPQQAVDSGLPVVLVINGIHAGEVEGKEASLMLVRDLLDGTAGDLLQHLVLLVVPLFNADGNERIDPNNRRLNLAALEGQLGPDSGVGTRVNASGVNLNRDYMRQEALEMRLLQSQVCQPWQPHLTVDCHSTNGSVHRFALTYDIPHTVHSGRTEPIEFMRREVLPIVTERTRQRAGIDCFYYGNFVTDEGGQGDGWMTYPHHPRFGSNYRGLTNRCDLLIETYSYISFEERVSATYHFLHEVLKRVAERGRDVVQLVASSQQPRNQVAVRYRLARFQKPVEILTRVPRTLEGAPTAVSIPHFASFVGTEVVTRPWAYAVPPEAGAAAEHVLRHGLKTRRLAQARSASVEVARVVGTAGEGSRKILESSHGETELQVAIEYETRTLPAGTILVETDQPLGAVAVYLCEARSDDNLVVCGVLPAPASGEVLPVYRVVEPV